MDTDAQTSVAKIVSKMSSRFITNVDAKSIQQSPRKGPAEVEMKADESMSPECRRVGKK